MRKKKNHTQVLAEEKVRISPYSTDCLHMSYNIRIRVKLSSTFHFVPY
jgi:hypothetical protein